MSGSRSESRSGSRSRSRKISGSRFEYIISGSRSEYIMRDVDLRIYILHYTYKHYTIIYILHYTYKQIFKCLKDEK